MKRTVVLAVLDGWGIGRKDGSNPVHAENPKNFNYIRTHFPSGALQSAGIAVGLPWGEEGNSEVGHLTLGAGKVVYQHFPRISLAIRDGSFFKNEAFKGAFAHAVQNNSSVNIVGLLTKANIHASVEHLLALIKFAGQEHFERLNLHLFSDGKDSPPQSVLSLLAQIPNVDKLLASLGGRHFGLDRDDHWDRTEKAYKTITGQTELASDYKAKIQESYAKNPSDQDIEPMLLGPVNRGIKSNDAVIFLDFREDSMRQIVSSFVSEEFEGFARLPIENLYAATMTQYSEKFPVAVAFPPEKVEEPLGKVLSDNNKIQLRIAETEKYAHVTFFFNGFKEPPFKNEYRVLIPSQRVAHHDEHPEMMAGEITNRVIRAIDEGGYDFILVNYANADMVAHTGNYEAAQKAIATVDESLGKLKEALFKYNGMLVITSDHGNVERMRNPLTGEKETRHDPNPVPVYLVIKELEHERSEAEVNDQESFPVGLLSDIAPTILELMAIQKPKEMTGQSLLKLLR